MKDADFCQDNLVNSTVSHMDGIPFPYPHQGFQEPIYAPTPTPTPIPTTAPMLAPILQPDPSANVATYAQSTITPQLLTSMHQMQQLMVQMQAN